MDRKIKSGEVEVVKKNKRKVEGKYILTVKFNNFEYKLCPDCNYYKKIMCFTKTVNGFHLKCKDCRTKELKVDYRINIDTQIRHRWYAIKKRSKEFCSKEEFTYFFYNEKCPYTNRTLYDDFINPHKNKLFRLEIDHIKSISEGGSSKIENLRVVPKFINQAKKDATSSEWNEVENYLFKF